MGKRYDYQPIYRSDKTASYKEMAILTFFLALFVLGFWMVGIAWTFSQVEKNLEEVRVVRPYTNNTVLEVVDTPVTTELEVVESSGMQQTIDGVELQGSTYCIQNC